MNSGTTATKTEPSPSPKCARQLHLHAFAEGVLGEFAYANITVEAGKDLDLGKLEWKPVRYGTQIWDIGYPDRTADKFYKGDGDNYWLWGWNLPLRPLLVSERPSPTSVGKSDYHKDWFFEEVPHARICLLSITTQRIPPTSASAGSKAESLSEYPPN